jgi:hypothetical protein
MSKKVGIGTRVRMIFKTVSAGFALPLFIRYQCHRRPDSKALVVNFVGLRPYGYSRNPKNVPPPLDRLS